MEFRVRVPLAQHGTAEAAFLYHLHAHRVLPTVAMLRAMQAIQDLSLESRRRRVLATLRRLSGTQADAHRRAHQASLSVAI
ncbi:hypothetical protein ACO0LB_20070 [Undibacterium sp. SXout7W]|uniref:hypothetical protein n=1 Tax=Undibacterium sp. SXout7W TaxID=3413049 RepID=UPI003BEFDB45